MSTQTLLTAEEFLEQYAGRPYELVRGEPVPVTLVTPEHGGICAMVAHRILQYDQDRRALRVATNDSGLLTERDPDTLRGADVLVYRHERLPNGRLPRRFTDIPPDLAVEVVSPEDRWTQVEEKVTEYLEMGVPLVWVIDPSRRRLHLYRPGQPVQILTEDDSLQDAALLPGFEARLRDLLG